jgi:hypothetical protein
MLLLQPRYPQQAQWYVTDGAPRFNTVKEFLSGILGRHPPPSAGKA